MENNLEKKVVLRFFKIIIISFATCIFSNQQLPCLEYVIRSVVNEDRPVLEVSLTFQGNEMGMTELLLPLSWAGQDQLYLEIENLYANSSQTVIEDSDRPDVKVIHYKPGQDIEIVYQVIPREKKDIEWYYRPIVTEEYFFFFGYSFFIIPYMNDQESAQISIKWNGFPSDWVIANSFGTDERKQVLDLPLSRFQHAVFAGGDFRIIQCGDPDTPIFIAIRGEWSFTDTWLANLTHTIIQMQREFWNDFEFPYYLITVLPIGDDHNMGGTGISNAFSLFMGDVHKDDIENRNWLAWLLSHEHFHTWNGLKMTSAPPEGALYWFTEGFTDYYAVKLLNQSHIIEEKNFVDYVNTVLYEYHTSPMYSENNERIERDFWNDYDVQKLPYQRGFLLAMRWDMKIDEESSGQYCLDHFMKALYQKSRKHGVFTHADIEQIASIFLSSSTVGEDLSKYIMEGKPLPLAEHYFVDKYFIKWDEDPGFYLKQTLLKGKIFGVHFSSNAYMAGLRNGQSFIDYEFLGDNISVTVLDENGNRVKIIYAKEQNIRFIPQYERSTDAPIDGKISQ